MRPYELECVHGVGHSAGVHGCDGCCGILTWPARAEAWDEGHNTPHLPEFKGHQFTAVNPYRGETE